MNYSPHDFSYDLPDDRIARHPLARRSDARLLVYAKGTIHEDIFQHLDAHIPSNAMIVMNTTKVIPARMYGKTLTGETIEIFCLEPHHPYTSSERALADQGGTAVWKCFIGNNRKWKDGDQGIVLGAVEGVPVIATRREKDGDSFFVYITWKQGVPFSTVLDQCGVVPLPPYMERDAEGGDRDRYQTIFATNAGAVAAPTASLHIDEDVLERLQSGERTLMQVTLHVGAGTFLPMKSSRIDDHTMHGEVIRISYDELEKLYQQVLHEQPIVAMGTTSVRTIESLVYFLDEAGKLKDHVGQWDWREAPRSHSRLESLARLLAAMQREKKEVLEGTTSIMITPDFPFLYVDGLITNFHQPQSTLLVLISAFVGERWKDIYAYALGHGFRFLSYGDGSLLWRKDVIY